MATPSIIAVKTGSQLNAVYCNNDGYLYGVGRCLLDHYNTQEKAEALVALGDLSSVGPRLAPEAGEPHSFDHPAPGVTVAYHRDRGEDLNPRAPFDLSNGVSVYDVVENLDDSGYVYVFLAGAWYYRDEEGRLVALTEDNTWVPWEDQGAQDTQEGQGDKFNTPMPPFDGDDPGVLYCQRCGSREYLENEDRNRNNYCGQCGQRIDWDAWDRLEKGGD